MWPQRGARGGRRQDPPSLADSKNFAKRLRDPDRFRVDELTDALNRKLPAEAGAFDSSEGEARVALDHSVDEDAARLDLVDQPALLRRVGGPNGGTQAEWGCVGESDRFVEITEAKETCDRTENLLLGARASGGHVGENRRGVEVPGPVEGLPAQQQTRSRFDCFLDLL